MFVIDDESNELVPLEESPYKTESELQELIARYPRILNGEESGAVRSYALVRREHGIGDDVGASDRWSVDHIFVDQDAVPTFVEVKRATDTRIRREVVGQMLDYAANAAEYLPEGRLRSSFEATCRASGADPASVIADLVESEDVSLDDYWAEVDRNLRRGRIRLVFCSDRMPKELRRIAEFLNAQTRETEVVALEVAQHLTPTGVRVIAPRVFGETLQTPQRVTTRQAVRSWTREEYLALADETGPPHLKGAIESLLTSWHERRYRIAFGDGLTLTALFPTIDHGEQNFWMVAIYPKSVEVQFQWMKIRPPFDRLAMREQLRDRLNQIDGVNLPADSIGRRPTFPSEVLIDPARRAQFLAVDRWFEETVRATPLEMTRAVVKPEEDREA